MKRLSFISLLVMTIASCSAKYELPNCESGEMINVTSYIEEEGYLPWYEKGHLVALINPKPHLPDAGDNETLSNYFLHSLGEFDSLSTWLTAPNHSDLAKSTKYVYSYVIYDEPVDVYETTVYSENHSASAYIRYNGTHFSDGYARDGWVTSLRSNR